MQGAAAVWRLCSLPAAAVPMAFGNSLIFCDTHGQSWGRPCSTSGKQVDELLFFLLYVECTGRRWRSY